MAKRKTAPNSDYCQARLKTCRNPDCRFRFPKGDKTWECARCGEDRQCHNRPLEGKNTCRVHGGKGGRPVIRGKVIVPAKNAENFNRIIGSPELMSLAQNQAMLEARANQLFEKIHDLDSSGADAAIRKGIEDIRTAIRSSDHIEFGLLNSAVSRMEKAIEPVELERAYWSEVRSNYQLIQRLNDTERKYRLAVEEMYTFAEVIEMIVILINMAMRYIQRDDAQKFHDDLKNYIPADLEMNRG